MTNSIDSKFKVTKEDILEIKRKRANENRLKEKHPIFYKIKQYFAKDKPQYIKLTSNEINSSWKTAYDKHKK